MNDNTEPADLIVNLGIDTASYATALNAALASASAWDAARVGVTRARALLGDVRTDAYRQPFTIAKSGPPHLTDQHTLMLMGVRAQATIDAARHARIAPELFIPQVRS